MTDPKTYWSSDESKTYRTTEITYLMYRDNERKYRRLHCVYCGLPVAEVNNQVLAVIDNYGLDLEVEEIPPIASKTLCKRCKQHIVIQV